MRLKSFMTFAFLLVFTVTAAQEITIDDAKVMLNGAQILKSEKINSTEYSFYSLSDDEELISFRLHNNETISYTQDDYFILVFPVAKLRVESKNTQRVFSGMGMNSRKNMEKLLNWLLKEKVIDETGKFNAERAENFATKYNENITERTVRY